MNSFKVFNETLELFQKIRDNPSDVKHVSQLKTLICGSSESCVQSIQKVIVSCFFPYIDGILNNRMSCTSQEKQLLVEALNEYFSKSTIDQPNVFFNFYTFLILEIYDYKEHKVRQIGEEYKLIILKCLTNLMTCVTFEAIEVVYVKRNVTKLSQIIYVCSELAKNEKSRNIRSEAINCIMAVARVLNDSDLSDTVLRSCCADIFAFFLPGLCSTLTEVALKDQRVGHKLIVLAIKAYGRIVSLVVQDYRASDQKENIQEIVPLNSNPSVSRLKFKDANDIDEYLNCNIRNAQWYRETDENLDYTFKKLRKLTCHSHESVRNEMVVMATDVIRNGARTIPISASTLIEHLIILSQDSVSIIAVKSNDVITHLSNELASNNLISVFENLEEGFYNAFNSLPRTFNSIDDHEKTASLSLLLGYIDLFGERNLNQILLSPNMLSNLLQNLLHITELQSCNVSLLEEYTLADLSLDSNFKCPWLHFAHFQENSVKDQIGKLCEGIVRHGCFELVYDFLVDTFYYNVSKKKEAIYLLNCLISGLNNDASRYPSLLKNVVNMYTEDSLNDLSVALHPDEYSLEQIRENVIVICLVTEGVGRISQVLKASIEPFLLKVLYLVLEKAGCGHPLIKTSGLLALTNLTFSCGYADVTHLVNSNFDFFSYQVKRKLIKLGDKEGVLNVLSVVLQYCSVDVLLPMKSIIEEVLLLSCDQFREKYANAYLKVFKMFVVCLRKWYKFEVQSEKIMSRALKESYQEHFKVSGIHCNNDFSDNVMENKSAEEMYQDDMKKKNDQAEEEINIANKENSDGKPQPPMHIELAAQILKRSLHFLPSKEQTRRLLVLEILENGVELLREWDDVLLPVVHQIWSPLVQRFQHDSDYLTMRITVRLLTTLARLSKDFIRMRVVKELLPHLRRILESSAQSSYLKDKGSTYRYSQRYKLQLEILTSISSILYNLDVDGKVITEVTDSVKLYLSDRQPQKLQAAAVDFFEALAQYDYDVIKEELTGLKKSDIQEYSKNLERIEKYLRDELAK